MQIRMKRTNVWAASFCLAVLTVCPVVADDVPNFVEVEEFGSDNTLNAAWADFDLDGDLDLAFGNYGSQNELYVNDGAGNFSRRAEFGSASGSSTFALVWGDYDNDGDPDMAVGKGGNRQNELYINNGDTTFTPRNEFGSLHTACMAWADYDKDGDLDLAVGNGILAANDVPEQNYLYVNNGDDTFTAQPDFGMGRTVAMAWGDYDNDGDLDLAVGNGGFGFAGQNYLYINQNGSFLEVEAFGLGDTTDMAWGDMNNDGLLDLVVGNWETGRNLLYVNNGDGTFTEQEAFGDRDTNTLSLGDFDNDGDLDVAVGNGDFGNAEQNYIYVNQGDATFAEFAEFNVGSTDTVVWADYDLDGDLDLAVGNEHTPRTNYLYINQENDSDYLILKLVGHHHDLGAGFSNRDGIGAVISVYETGFICDADHFIAMRQVEAQGGFKSQDSIEVEFGLPGQETVDVRIDWPGSSGSSIVQVLTGVAVGQHLTIDEQQATPAVDCNGNGVLDACDILDDVEQDCNANDIPDVCDIADQTSDDCTGNGIPDECEPDCNGNDVADSCDIDSGTSEDCTGNGIPDECEPDCNDTGLADTCDILAGTSEDCSGNWIPDECEPDCNDTGEADSCDIFNLTSPDCNENLVPDECDLADGTSLDENGNGIPDECDECPYIDPPQLDSRVPDFGFGTRNRYISLVAGSEGMDEALRVTFENLPAPYDTYNGDRWWVTQPSQVTESSGSAGSTPPPTFWAATLSCSAEPFYTDWTQYDVVHVYHEGIIADATYVVHAIPDGCNTADESYYSDPLSVTTSALGDVVGDCGVQPCSAPQGVIDFVDISAVVDKFRNLETALQKARADVINNNVSAPPPDRAVDFVDISSVVDAFRASPPTLPGPQSHCP